VRTAHQSKTDEGAAGCCAATSELLDAVDVKDGDDGVGILRCWAGRLALGYGAGEVVGAATRARGWVEMCEDGQRRRWIAFALACARRQLWRQQVSAR
jgi:hypothetical protein